MFKVLWLSAMFGSIFWAGYFVGQQPPGEVKAQIRTFSEDMMERALGLKEHRLILQREFLEAKSRVVQGKSDVLDGEYDEAAKEMDQALAHLKKAVHQEEGVEDSSMTDQIMAKIEKIKTALASGDVISKDMIDEVQQRLDHLLDG